MAPERTTAARRMIDAYASEPHYRDHIAPVFDSLPEGLKGSWNRRGSGPVIVAGYKDLLAVGDRPAILMEHGAGQTYGGGHPSYAGGRNREGVQLFLCPSERVADLNRARYPKTPAVAVGCPKLDALIGVKPGHAVGFAWHWNAQVCPESRSALRHYASFLGEIAWRHEAVGTAHPRIASGAAKVYADAGIEFVGADELMARAAVLIVDNSSIGWEFIALDRPVIWANAPWYRRGVHHGLRFWEDADIQVDESHELEDAIAIALEDAPERRMRRHSIAAALYGECDGHSAERGAAAILERFGG